MAGNAPLPDQETRSPPAASPRWLRRADTSPGVIDTAAARRAYARTAGWAIQRIARAGNLFARHLSTDGGDAAGDLPLARAPIAVASAEGGTGPAVAAPSPAASSAAATRLHRRVAGPGAVQIQLPHAPDRAAASVSLRAGPHERLAARSGSAPQPTPAVAHLARRADPFLRDNESGRSDPIFHRVSRARDAAASLTGTSAAVAPAVSRAPLGLPAPAQTAGASAVGLEPRAIRAASVPNGTHAVPVSVSRTAAPVVARKPIGTPAHPAPEPAAPARIPETVAPAVSRTPLSLRAPTQTAGASAVEPEPPAVRAANAPNGTQAVPVSVGRTAAPVVARKPIGTPAHPAPEPAALARTPEAVAAASRNAAGTATLPAHISVPSAFPVTQLVSSSPLTLARTPDFPGEGATRALPAHDSMQAQAEQLSVPARGAIARTAEIPGAEAPTAPILVWRTGGHADTRTRSARSHHAGNSGMLMRAPSEGGYDAASAAASGPVSIPPTTADDAGTRGAAAPAPDMNQLAEQVTRLIARRLEIERDRRGGKPWT